MIGTSYNTSCDLPQKSWACTIQASASTVSGVKPSLLSQTRLECLRQ